MAELNSLSSSNKLGSKPTMKKTVGAMSSGMAANKEREDMALCSPYIEYFESNMPIFSFDTEKREAFLQEISSLSVTTNQAKAKIYFLKAWCFYWAKDYTAAEELILKAIGLCDDIEYQLFNKMVMSKNEGYNYMSRKIAIDALNLSAHYYGASSIFYSSELNPYISSEAEKYKSEKMKEASARFFKQSLICVPLFLYVYYKYSIYVAPEGWFSFSWNPVYISFMFIIGCIYVPYFFTFISKVTRTLDEWKNEMKNEYQ